MAPKRKRSGLLLPKTKRVFSGSWSQLPIDVLDNIIRRLELPVDAVSFSGVCKSWRYVALGMHMSLYCKVPFCHVIPRRSPLPMLLHPGCKGPSTHRLYCLNEQKIYGKFHLRELSNKWIVGSGAGWLVIVDTVDPEVALLNPLTGKKIPLPHLSTIPNCGSSPGNEDRTAYWNLRKVIVCSYQGSFLIVALVSRFKAIRFCKIGDSEWTRLQNSPIYVDDIIMQNGKLYAVNRFGSLFETDVSDPAKTALVAMRTDVFPGRGKRFLVTLCGELVLLERLLLKFGRKKASQVTSGFKVFKLVGDKSEYYSDNRETEMGTRYQQKSGLSWVPLKNLGHHMVFIGYNHSVSLDSRVYPRCKGNCIYFADNRFDEYDHARMRGPDKKICHDVGVYRMAGRKVKHFKRPCKASSPMNMVWLSPSFSSELEMETFPQ